MSRLTNRWRELRRYFLVSCIGLSLDVGILLLLRNFCGVPYLLAGTVSFIAGCAVGYYLCVRFVFEPAGGARPLALLLFIVLGGIGLTVNAAVLALCVEMLRTPLLGAKAAAAACTFVTNYVLRKRWVFTPEYQPASVAVRELTR